MISAQHARALTGACAHVHARNAAHVERQNASAIAGPKASFFQLFHVLDFSMFSIFCFGGGLARPQSVRAQERMCAHMILLACSTEFQSVWSVISTVAHVSKVLRMIADIGSQSRLFRPT